jgi:DNA-binding SARP family transcriptional activator
MSHWHLNVLGTASLIGEGQQFRLERKTVGLLTYLALEGPTPRSKIAGLLWPESGESTARSNLRQVLSRLKKSTKAELVTADDLLKLQLLEVDAAKLKVLAFANSDEALQSTGHLLAPHDYDDCPDFADWLFAERERLQSLRQNALNSKIKTLEQTAHYSEALHYAQKLLEIEPLAEDVHRQVMRLHYLTGDRAAALAAFERCKNVLQKELGVEPLAETLKLVSEIEFGALLPTALPTAKQKAELPLRVLRPPLVGREEAWQRMSEAWHNHQAIFISGVPGVGKSRLMQEFVVASQKPHCLFEARLGDASVPYATNTRNFRKMISEFPVTLSSPLKRELARILSELGDAPAPISNESELVRFYDAQEKTVRLAMEAGLAALAYDDVQYVDAASLQGWLHSSANHMGKPDGIKLIASFRKGELLPETQKSLEHLVASGFAVLIELEPLPETEVNKLIDNLGITDLQPLSEQLSRYTGGNPLFIVETIKHLIESEQLGTGTFALPTTGKVFALLKDRLGRLSTEAQRLTWTAAVAQTQFSLELASSILVKSPFDLADSFEELEASNVFSGLRFSHDLLFETALTTIPSPIKVYLHRRCAEELEKVQASPATIAEHWLSAGEEERAVPRLLELARQLKDNFQYVEAVKVFDKVIDLLEKYDHTDEIFEVIYEQRDFSTGVTMGERQEHLVHKVFNLVSTLEQKAKACEYAIHFYLEKGDADKLEHICEEGYGYALELEDLYFQGIFLKGLGAAYWLRGQSLLGIKKLKQALEIIRKINNIKEQAELANGIGVMLIDVNGYDEAEVYFDEAETMYTQLGLIPELVSVLRNRALNRGIIGKIKEAATINFRALELLNQTSGSLEVRLMTQINWAGCLYYLSDYTNSLNMLEDLRQFDTSQYANNVMLDSQCGRLYLQLGDYKKAGEFFLKAINAKDLPPVFRLSLHLAYISLLVTTGTYKGELDGLQDLPGDTRDELLKLYLEFKLSHRLETVLRGKSLAHDNKLKGWEIVMLSLCTTALLQEKPEKALEYSTEMMKLLETYDANGYRGEVLFSHYQALVANKKAGARNFLKDVYTWLLYTADNNVPPEYRKSFLNNNPTNKAILEAAKASGLMQKTLV